MKYLYNLLIYNPLLNLLILFYQTIAFQNIGLAIILLTILVRIILLPLSNKAQKQQLILQKIQPEIVKIQKKYKNNIQKQTQEIFALYKDTNINPFSIYFLIFIQLPIFYALFKIFSQDFTNGSLVGLYSFINQPKDINILFLGLINLTKPSIIIAALVALFQYLQTKTMIGFLKTKIQNNYLNLFNYYVVPLILFIVVNSLPSAVGLYFLTSNTIDFISKIFINKKFIKQEKNELE